MNASDSTKVDMLSSSAKGEEPDLDNVFPELIYSKDDTSDGSFKRVMKRMNELESEYGVAVSDIVKYTFEHCSVKEIAEKSDLSEEKAAELVKVMVQRNILTVSNSLYRYRGRDLLAEYQDVVSACEAFFSTKSSGIMILRMNSENQFRVARLLFALARDLTKKRQTGCIFHTVETWTGYFIQARRNGEQIPYKNNFFNEKYPDMVFFGLDFSWRGWKKDFQIEGFTELLKSCETGNRHFLITTQEWPGDDIPGDELRKILEAAELIEVSH